jgi:hypothetical protein
MMELAHRVVIRQDGRIVAEETTSICADFVVELRGSETVAIAGAGIRQSQEFLRACRLRPCPRSE